MRNKTLRLFVNKDAEYLAWIATNRAGFVVNCHRVPDPEFLILHRATCVQVNPPKYKNWTSVGFIKVAAMSVEELQAWAFEGTGAQLKPCPQCLPEAAVRAGASNGTGLHRMPAQTASTGTGLHRVPDPGSMGTGEFRRPSAASGEFRRPTIATEDDEPAPARAIPQVAPERKTPVPGPRGGLRLALRSGMIMDDPLPKILQFCRMEYDYFDGIPDPAPDRITPVDVLVTVACFPDITADPLVVRDIHLQIAERCDPLLAGIPEDADLLGFDPSLQQLHGLLHAAFQAPLIPIAAAAKILHRKRPGYVPALSTPALHYYLDISGRPALKDALRQKSQGATIFAKIVKLFREDLTHVPDEIAAVRTQLAREGYKLSEVRTLELLQWIYTDELGFYRE